MEQPIWPAKVFNIVIVPHRGRLSFEATLFALSLRHTNPDFAGRFFVATPAHNPLWPKDPSLPEGPLHDLLGQQGVEFVEFKCRDFGQAYPFGNKIEALDVLPVGEPFVFFDSDTLITGDLNDVPFDFARPGASLRREGTWPKTTKETPNHATIWRALYDRFGLDFAKSLDCNYDATDWRRYLYFNAGFFYYRCPKVFGQLYRAFAVSIRNSPPSALAGQTLDPWLDQVALPLVIHALGGGRDSLPSGFLDGRHSCHYRLIPLLYARESQAVVTLLEDLTTPDHVKTVFKIHPPYRRLIYERQGQRLRQMFDQAALPETEQMIRKTIKQTGLWLR